jgi:hypothetical protein
MFEISLPSKKKVQFSAPTFNDRRLMLKNYDRAEGYLPEDLLAAKCLTHVNESPVQQDWETEPINRFNGWSLKDQAYYLEVFMNMFSLDEKTKEAAAQEAKKLMGMTGTPKPSQVATRSSGSVS